MTLHTSKLPTRAGSKLMLVALAAALLSASACVVEPHPATNSEAPAPSPTPSQSLATAPVAAAEQPEDPKCATSMALTGFEDVEGCFLNGDPPAPARPPGSVLIPVYFHILISTTGEGDVCDQVLKAQINVLNDSFAGRTGGAPTAFRFFLAGTDRTVNKEWFDMVNSETPTQAEIDAKTLNKGDKSSLNIYTANVLGSQGWARWPWELEKKVDGVVVPFSTLPGGARGYYNLGDVVTHEVGHWLGLFHTWERGCTAPGDCVDDTYAEANLKRYCETGYDTCPSQPGLDPYENFMNYTYDHCMYRFTGGQAARMDAIHRKYRT